MATVTRGHVIRIGTLALLLACAGSAPAMDLTALGDWTRLFTAADLTGGPGTDLPASADSDSSQIALNVLNCSDSADAWRLEVARSGPAWPAGVHLYARRTGDGVGAGAVSGGLSYLEISPTEQTLFSGAGDRSAVSVQLRLTGLSVSLSVATHTASLTFRLVDLP